MTKSWISRLLKKKSRPLSRSGPILPHQGRFVPSLEILSDRILPSVTAVFVPPVGVLTVFGDAQDNNITLSRDAAGKILVNGGAVTIFGGTPTVANTASISVFGEAGNDTHRPSMKRTAPSRSA